MKINPLDAHDRLNYFTNKRFDISECCQDLINQRPFGDHPFYIFAHARSLGMDEKFKLFSSGQYPTMSDVPDKTLVWQPRLTKPQAQENSMLFKAYPGSDNIKIIWILPPRETWKQFEKGKMTENKTICESIYDFLHNKHKLEAKEPDDLSDTAIDKIYSEMSIVAAKQKRS